MEILYGDNIKNCSNTGEISGKVYVGGIVGYIQQGLKTKIENCRNLGTVIGTESVGGITGNLFGGIIETCYNKGEISGNDKLGGIAGRIDGSREISIANCYSKGKITGNSNIGAIIGSNTVTGTVIFSKLYYLQSLGIGGINGADIEGQVEGIDEEIDSFEHFLSWIETK